MSVNTLDFVYTTENNAYKAVPRPHLGYSDHISVMLIPAYRLLLQLAKPVQKLITIWPENATSTLQYCFQCTDWNMFKETATIVPIKLTSKLTGLGLNTSLCDWIQDFLTGRPQVVKVGQFTSNSITLNVGAPQGCVLSPLLYSLYTHDCVSSHRSTSIIKFADDTVVLGLISNNDETAYLDEVENSHHGARTTVSLWMWAKLKSWLWTSERDTCCPTLLLWSVGPLWRE